ncbi:MAG: c-type cytochrome [Chitinophagaceae bacterium]|nr:MAG: c-type cytochrome [Chitinophagaceae bacterium]
MKKVFRYLLIGLLVIVVAAGGFAAFVAIRGIPEYSPEKIALAVNATPERIAKGRQLSSMLCNGCHMDENTGKLTGRAMDEVPQFGTIYSKNITKDPEHGIGKWTDGEIAYLLRTGITPKGRFLPVMAKLHRMSDEDIQSVIAFLRSGHMWVSADNTQHPASSYSFLAKFLANIKVLKPMSFPKGAVPEPDTTNKVKWGEYVCLYRVECYTCHSADFTTDDFENPEKSKGFFGGGNKFELPGGKEIYSRNLTMDEETGIGKWTEDEFVRAVKTGIVPGGQPSLRQPMKPYVDLSDNEVRAIYAYLKTLPSIKNKVERNF